MLPQARDPRPARSSTAPSAPSCLRPRSQSTRALRLVPRGLFQRDGRVSPRLGLSADVYCAPARAPHCAKCQQQGILLPSSGCNVRATLLTAASAQLGSSVRSPVTHRVPLTCHLAGAVLQSNYPQFPIVRGFTDVGGNDKCSHLH